MGSVLITGATDGIGFLLAKAYAKAGNRVLATGRQLIVNEEQHFSQTGITYIRADQEFPIMAADMVSEAFQNLKWKQLDLAILNAAIGWSGSPEDETASSICSQITINLTGTIALTSSIAPYLLQNQGKLVLIGSTAAKGNANFATYASTKAGLKGFARSLQEEWRGRASVQIIHPGPTRTTMHAKAGMNIGPSRMLFMSPKSASRAIQRFANSGTSERKISKTYAFTSQFLGRKAGEL